MIFVILPSPYPAHAGYCGEGIIVRFDNFDCILVRIKSETLGTIECWITWRRLKVLK
jgi:hypothetical protein